MTSHMVLTGENVLFNKERQPHDHMTRTTINDMIRPLLTTASPKIRPTNVIRRALFTFYFLRFIFLLFSFHQYLFFKTLKYVKK